MPSDAAIKHHPLYAFLRPPSSPPLAASSPPPTLRPDSSSVEPPQASSSDLVRILAAVHAHSAQLDSMVHHLSSLVARVESVESATQLGHEDVHRSLDSLQLDADRIAVAASDRATRVLSPILGSFNTAMGCLSNQLHSFSQKADHTSQALLSHGDGLVRVEKDLEELRGAFRGLECQLLREREEHRQNAKAYQDEIHALKSALGPLQVLTPLFQTLLQTRLQSDSAFELHFGSEKESRCYHPREGNSDRVAKRRGSCPIKIARCRSLSTSSRAPMRCLENLMQPGFRQRKRSRVDSQQPLGALSIDMPPRRVSEVLAEHGPKPVSEPQQAAQGLRGSQPDTQVGSSKTHSQTLQCTQELHHVDSCLPTTTQLEVEPMAKVQALECPSWVSLTASPRPTAIRDSGEGVVQSECVPASITLGDVGSAKKHASGLFQQAAPRNSCDGKAAASKASEVNVPVCKKSRRPLLLDEHDPEMP